MLKSDRSYIALTTNASFDNLKNLQTPFSTETAGVPHSNGTRLSDGRNAGEAYPPNKLDINADRIFSTNDIILP